MISLLTRGADKEDFDIEAWCLVGGGKIAEELQDEGISVKSLNIVRFKNPINVFKLALQLKKEKVDILHMHGFYSSLIGISAALLSRINVRIIHIHTSYYNLDTIHTFLNKWINIFASKIVYVSESSFYSFIEAGYQKNNSMVIYNGVDFQRKNTPVSSATDRRIIIIVASLFAHKGHKFLLSAISTLVGQYPDLQLWIVGQGPLENDLKEQTQALKIGDHITFWGERTDVFDLLKQSQIFILPSLREGMPISLLEAMSMGKAIVASDVGGVSELIEDGVSGFLIPAKNSDAMAEKISLLLGSEKIQKEMGQEARRRFEEKFTSKRMVDKFENLYRKLFKEKICKI